MQTITKNCVDTCSPKRNRRVVVVGSRGRLGTTLVQCLKSIDYVVFDYDRDHLDLGSETSIMRALEPIEYDELILTGALTGVDYCERHAKEAHAVNAVAPRIIAEISAAKMAHVTYISTDMVFNGLNEKPYTENDKPDPISIYGASKLDGEVGILSASKDNLILRVSWVFGPGRPAFPEWIIAKSCYEHELSLPADKYCCPTYTIDLVNWLSALLFSTGSKPASGVFHLCNSSPCSWLEWGHFCVTTAIEEGFPVLTGDIQGVSMHSIAAFLAKRPVYSALDTSKLTEISGIRPRDWREAVRDHVILSPTFKKYSSAVQETSPVDNGHE